MTLKSDWSAGNAFSSDDANAVASAVNTATAGIAALALTKTRVFDARDYGVIADGTPHNNVANLLDAMAALKTAGGGELLLPAGIIDTSDAVIGTVTANSGSTYYNQGGIPLPSAMTYAGTGGNAPVPNPTPITVTGHGKGVTVLRLSTGFTRGFDMWTTYYYISSGVNGFPNEVWSNIHIQGITFDRNNISGPSLGPLTTMPIATTTGYDGTGLYVAPNAPLPIPNPQNWKNARVAYFPQTNTKQVITYTPPAALSGSMLTNYPNGYVSTGSSNYFAAGATVVGGLYDHVIVGNIYFFGMYGNGFNCSFKNILVEDCEAINVTTIAPSTFVNGGNVSDLSTGIGFATATTSTTGLVFPTGYAPTIKNIVIRNVTMSGGSTGISITGGAGTFIDDVWIDHCSHDTLHDPTTFFFSSNYIIGGSAWVGRGGIFRSEGRRSGDVGIELDQPWEFYIDSCRLEESRTCGVYLNSFVPPARTSAGPPTSTLGGDIGTSDTTVTISSALPAGTALSGVLRVGSELMWYQAATSTSLTLWRGINGSTAATHASGATITFIETAKTRIMSSSNEFYGQTALLSGGTACCYQANAQALPVSPLTVRDDKGTFIGSGFGGAANNPTGQFLSNAAWMPDIDIQGVDFLYSGFTAGADASLITENWTQGAALASIPCDYPRFFGRNNRFRWHGSTAANHNFSAVRFDTGFARMDFDVEAEIVMSGITSHSATTGVNIVSIANAVLAPGSRLGIKGRSPSGMSSDAAPSCLTIGSSATISKVLNVDIDATEMAFTSSTLDANYVPWQINSGNVGKVRFGRVRHSTSVTAGYPELKRNTVLVTSSYTVGPTDEIVLVDSSSAAVTITLPVTNAGGSTIGEPLARGRMLYIVDAGLYAAGNNITIAPASGEKIDGSTSSQVISVNGAAKTYTTVVGQLGWIGVGIPSNLVYTDASQTLTNKTITAPRIAAVLDYYGAVHTQNYAPASAVNYFSLQTNTAGGTPTLAVLGADPDISLNLQGKGAGSVTAAGHLIVTTGSVPSTATSTGIVGQIASDSSYVYICTATNTWKRAAIASW